MTLLSNLKTTGRAAIIAIALGASSLTAAPALAQRGGGDGPSVNFSIELNGGGYSERHRGGDFNLRCLTNRQIREELRDFGFRRIEVGRNLGRNRVEVFARYDGDDYSMRVNRCTGRVDRVRNLDW